MFSVGKQKEEQEKQTEKWHVAHSFAFKTVNQFKEFELLKLTEAFLCIFNSNDMHQKFTELVNVLSGR